MNHNDSNSDSYDLQGTFSGGAIDANTLTMRRRVMDALGIDYETAAEYVDGPGVLNDWNRLLAVDGIEDVDPGMFTDRDRRIALLWTAEVAGQTGERAADLAWVHMETDGEIESFFRSDKYAREVFDELAPPDDWHFSGSSRQESPRFLTEAGDDELLLAFYDDRAEVWVDKWGHASDPMDFAWVEGSCEFRVLGDDPIQVIHHDMMYEHTDPVTIATTEGTFKFQSRGGVMWETFGDDEAPEWAWDTAAAVYKGELEGYERVGTGWHSSMERSDLSDLINEITRGEFHDSAPSEISPAPVIVKFSGTGNVCSIGITVWTTDEFAPELEEIVSNARAAPGYAGVR